ncbi:MAG: nitroreductase [Clostridiales bacterium]|nr:nitroreductase [Clostridiales bacterium]MCD7828143.1 nitroreductase [Clostridiales bacterium]
MTLQEAMAVRHTVRKYKNTPLSADMADKLNCRISEQNKKYGLSMKLVTQSNDAMPAIFAKTMSKGVRNYIIIAGPNTPDICEKLGYSSADVMLYAQTLGLNTWWIGGMYSRKNAKKNLGAGDNAKIVGIVAVGYGEEQGVPHKSKAASEVASYAGTAPDWFNAGVAAALLAPTAMNKQEFTICGNGNQVSMTCGKGSYSDVDLGISKYHFELGAGTENFTWM